MKWSAKHGLNLGKEARQVSDFILQPLAVFNIITRCPRMGDTSRICIEIRRENLWEDDSKHEA